MWMRFCTRPTWRCMPSRGYGAGCGSPLTSIIFLSRRRVRRESAATMRSCSLMKSRRPSAWLVSSRPPLACLTVGGVLVTDPRSQYDQAMSLTRQEVAHLARLSRLALSDEELDHLGPQLDVILTSVARVAEAGTPEEMADVPPTSHAIPMTNAFRPDVVRP